MAAASTSPNAASGWTSRALQPGDEPRLAELLAATFDGWPSVEVAVDPVEHLRWKLANHPDASRYHVVADAGTAIVGSRLFLVQDVLVGGRAFRARQEVDAAVHPDWQGRGVMSDMVRFANEAHGREPDLWYAVRSRHAAMLHLNESDDAEAFFSKVSVVERRLDAADDANAHPPRAVGMTVQPVEVFDERVDALFAEASATFAFIVRRDRSYLDWRYADPRAGRYSITLAEEGERLVGYVVASVSHGQGAISDLLTLPGRDDVVASLLLDAEARLREAGVSAVECWSSPSHPYAQVLRQLGYLRKRRTIGLKFVPRGATREELAALGGRRARLHIMAGDTDLV